MWRPGWPAGTPVLVCMARVPVSNRDLPSITAVCGTYVARRPARGGHRDQLLRRSFRPLPWSAPGPARPGTAVAVSDRCGALPAACSGMDLARPNLWIKLVLVAPCVVQDLPRGPGMVCFYGAA
jgi:hypothetical protein